MSQEIYVVIEFYRETHEFSEIEAICQSKEEAENLIKDYNAKFLRYSYELFEETYHVEVDAVLAEKDAEIRRLTRALWLARAELCRRLDVDRYLRNHRNSWYNENCLTWAESCVAMEVTMCKAESKCRAKAEQYK